VQASRKTTTLGIEHLVNGLEVCAMARFVAYIRDESGASAAEYALILAIVGTAIASAMLLLGSSIANAVNKAANCIATPSATCGS
jgi:pilus assembly protein Flp/PilA